MALLFCQSCTLRLYILTKDVYMWLTNECENERTSWKHICKINVYVVVYTCKKRRAILDPHSIVCP